MVRNCMRQEKERKRETQEKAFNLLSRTGGESFGLKRYSSTSHSKKLLDNYENFNCVEKRRRVLISRPKYFVIVTLEKFN